MLFICLGIPDGSVVKNPLAMQEMWANTLEEKMATHSSILAWKIWWRGAWWATVHGVAKSDTNEQSDWARMRAVRLFMGAWPEKSDGEEPGGLQSMGLQSRTRMSRVTEHARVPFVCSWVLGFSTFWQLLKNSNQHLKIKASKHKSKLSFSCIYL